jgi:toxin ParE1/3/4
VNLEWSLYARADRETIFDYIAAENTFAAIEIDERIQRQTENLRSFPESGRLGRVKGTRELVINRTPYIAAYQITANLIRILRVLA